jgi:alpha-L-fucosidase 2
LKKKLIILLCFSFAIIVKAQDKISAQAGKHDLVFKDIAKTWDEGMPLGNAFIGALVWQKGNALRMSLDRVDLWDLRPMQNINSKEFSFQWVYDQVMKKDYYPVQHLFDEPYDKNPAPSKIPGAALEFSLEKAGDVEDIHLYLKNAVCKVKFKSGMVFSSFVHANQPVGWFIVENIADDFIPELIPPVYKKTNVAGANDPVNGLSLSRLGYEQGTVDKQMNKITYHQKGWNGFYYDVAVQWKRVGKNLIGVWSITSSLIKDKAEEITDKAITKGIGNDYASHSLWWKNFWAKSSVHIPDSILEKQYYNEIYKLGSVARQNSYPISLQAVWTADNGNLPPWKGDYHNDLNTQLSYWPVYTGNYLSEGMGYLNTLISQEKANELYTKTYFGKNGLNVPGVSTLTGEPMGGWIQYSFSPTVAAWLSQHFYLHWKYSADQKYLKEKGYPYLKKVATFLEEITIEKNGVRTLPISSSPEIYNNSLQAWFLDITNYDLSLISFAWKAAAEMAQSLGLKTEAAHWASLNKKLPSFDLDNTRALTFAPGHPYKESHRHFSNMMAIHPLGLIDWSKGEKDQEIIKASIHKLDSVGPSQWCGYSYSWLGNMKARAMDGVGAAEALRIFATCFCLRNTFHANGDQSKTGKSSFTYRPFTLEGNFAFASGIQEMLIQSHTGIIELFPAIPADWKDVSFQQLRAQGAFLISAERRNGKMKSVKIVSEKGGQLNMMNPFATTGFVSKKTGYKINKNIITIETKPGQEIILTAKK